MKVSIIIPTRNEAENIQQTLLSLAHWRSQGHEVIVVDGGSSDQSLELATTHADMAFVSAQEGRAAQMNAGAEKASGDVLLFLHADTLLPGDALSLIANVIQHDRFWGRFDVKLSGKHFMFRVIARMMNWRSCLTGIATGDQGIFVKTKTFKKVGGFTDMPLMEDIELSKRLKRVSKPACIRSQLITSSRRWEENGIFSTILLMWRLRLAYYFGVPAEKLASLYR